MGGGSFQGILLFLMTAARRTFAGIIKIREEQCKKKVWVRADLGLVAEHP